MTATNQHNIVAIDRLLGRLSQELQRTGYRRQLLAGMGGDVDLATIRAIGAVQRAADSVTVGAVAETLGIDASTASRVVGAAVDAGYLQRRTSQHDARARELKLAPSGRELLERARQVRCDLLAQCLAGWTEEELSNALPILQRLANDLDELGREKA